MLKKSPMAWLKPLLTGAGVPSTTNPARRKPDPKPPLLSIQPALVRSPRQSATETLLNHHTHRTSTGKRRPYSRFWRNSHAFSGNYHTFQAPAASLMILLCRREGFLRVLFPGSAPSGDRRRRGAHILTIRIRRCHSMY